MFITDSNLLLFQRKYKNKDCIQKLGLAIMMAQKAEQISIQVGKFRSHTSFSLGLGTKNKSYSPSCRKLALLPSYTVLVLELVFSSQAKFP